MEYLNSKIKLVQGDITELKVDAIVNAANNRLAGGSGVNGAIHRRGGPEVLKECKKLGGCPTGEARIATAGKLPSKYVIHTVGPIYKGGKHNEEELLSNAYYNSLKLAVENGLKTIAFPSISTGIFGYPLEEASSIAIRTVKDFINEEGRIAQVIFVAFSQKDFEVYNRKLSE